MWVVCDIGNKRTRAIQMGKVAELSIVTASGLPATGEPDEKYHLTADMPSNYVYLFRGTLEQCQRRLAQLTDGSDQALSLAE